MKCVSVVYVLYTDICKPLVSSKLIIFSISAINIYEMYISWSEPPPFTRFLYFNTIYNDKFLTKNAHEDKHRSS